ncbi:MAG TPA: hypothetical protein VHC72_11095, partial [Bryobacteraceae bacterium]|nr:hypothetical protein [Bryobacteraceae bacterium]
MSWILLACQMAVPWVAPHFVTSDGPSHLYGATVARDLIFHHRHSIYSAVYTIQRGALPNWTATVLLAAAETLVDVRHAEQLFVSFSILLGFLGLCYMNHQLSPGRSPWDPVMNFVLQSWFLWVGFYNFYLGMMLVPFVVGFYIARAGRLTFRGAGAIAAGLTALYFTHLIAVAVALAAIAALAAWVCWIAPLLSGRRGFGGWNEAGLVLLSALPAVILILIYAHGAPGADPTATSQIASALKRFPQQVFLTGQGLWGRQSLLWPFVLCYIVAASLLMTRREWASPRGGLVPAVLIAFLGYLLIPDSGFGGSVVTIRFAWAVFILGAPLAASATRLRFLHVPIALYVAFFVFGNVIASARE